MRGEGADGLVVVAFFALLMPIINISDLGFVIMIVNLPSGIAFVLYIAVNYLFVPRFVGYRGAAADRSRMAVSTARFYYESHGDFWTKTPRGKRTLVLASLCFSSSTRWH